MTDLDRLLEKASGDVQKSLRTVSAPSAATIHRRARTRTIAAGAATAVLVAGVGVSAVLLSNGGSGGDVASNPDGLITTEMILEDGVVTEEEYRSGADAMVACLTNAGVEASVEYDGGGYAGFSVGSSTDTPEEAQAFEAPSNRCMETHQGAKVYWLRGVQRGEIDPDKNAEYYIALLQCVEERSGKDFGEATFDSDGFITPEGEQALQQATFAEQDNQSWIDCLNEIDVKHLSGWLDPGDRDVETEPDLDVVERSGLTLTLRDRFRNACIGVKAEKGAAGGCGADFAEPLNIGVGGIDGQLFVDGWTLGVTAKVVVTLADGTEIEVTDLIPVDGLDVLFFLELIPPTEDGEPELPVAAVAFDGSGEIIAEFVLSEPDAPKP